MREGGKDRERTDIYILDGFKKDPEPAELAHRGDDGFRTVEIAGSRW